MDKKEKQPDQGLKRELSLGAATAIVVGNMMGSGVFTSPQTLAQVTNPFTNLLAWVITGIGAVLLALSFAHLGTLYPETGGPIVYVEKAYGHFMAFLIAWTFWIGGWIGNAAIITTIIRYMILFLPGLATNPFLCFMISSAILWLFTGINMQGVKEAGFVGIVSTLLKLLVIVVFIVIVCFGFQPNYFQTISSPSVSGFTTLPSAITVALWSFIGLESATISAGEIRRPEVNIKRSTFWGTVFAAVIYLIIAILAIGGLPQAALATSEAPLAAIIDHITGARWGGQFIAIGIILSALGAISGWILTTARIAFAAGEEKLFPAFFARVSKERSTPWIALVVTGVCTNIMFLLNYVLNLTAAFDFMVNLATLSFIPAYALTAGADVLLRYSKANFRKSNLLRPLLAFLYSLYIIYGAGATSAMWLLILMFAGVPFYIYQKISERTE